MYLHRYCISTLRCLLRPASIQAGLLRVYFCEDGKGAPKHEMATQETDLGVAKIPSYGVQLRNAEADEFMRTLNDEMKEQKARIEFIMEQLRDENERVPKTISSIDWKIMLTEISGYYALRKYCRYLFKKEVSREREMLQKTQRWELRQQRKSRQPEAVLSQTHISKNQYFAHRLELKWKRNRVITLGQPDVVIDLDYEQSVREERILWQQLLLFLVWNMHTDEPMRVHLTSVLRNSVINAIYNSKEEQTAPCIMHDKHFIEIFPKEKLIYLSSEGAAWRGYFNKDKIYVMGGFADKYSPRQGESFGKAKELGIECRSFPLSRHVKFIPGSRAGHPLTCDIPLKIIHNMNLHGDWERALLDHLPLSCYSVLSRGKKGRFKPRTPVDPSVNNSYNKRRINNERYKQIMYILSKHKSKGE